MQKKEIRPLVVNALVAAIYVAIFYLIPQFGYGPIQFRVSEGLNHLNAYSPKYKWGIVLGVFVSNIYGYTQGLGWYDLVFGTIGSLITLYVCDYFYKRFPSEKGRLATTTIVFGIMMFIVAFELKFAFGLPFWFTYFTVSISEIVMLAITAPLFAYINRITHFDKQI